MSSDLAGCEPAAISTLDGKPRTQSANGTYHRSAALTGGGLERDSQLVSNLLRALAESEKPQHLKFPRGWLIHSTPEANYHTLQVGETPAIAFNNAPARKKGAVWPS